MGLYNTLIFFFFYLFWFRFGGVLGIIIIVIVARVYFLFHRTLKMKTAK